MSKLDDAIKKVEKLSKDLEKLTKKQAPTFDLSNLKKADQAINSLESSIELATRKAIELEEGFGGIASAIGAAINEMDKSSSPLNRTKKAMRGINSIAQDLKSDQQDLNKLTLDQLKSRKDKLALLTDEAKNQAKLASDQYKQLVLDKEGNKLSKIALAAKLKSKNISQKEFKELQSINAAHESNLSILDEANKKLQGRIELEEDVQSKLGITGGILKGISKIPILGDVFDANETVKEMEGHLRNGGSSIGAMAKGFSNIGKQVKDGLLSTSNLVLVTFTFILDVFKKMDTSAGNLAKGMNMSYNQGVLLNQEFRDIANASGDIMINQKGLEESLLAINSTMGTNAMLSDETLKTFTKLRETAGLTNEELMGATKLSLANGKSLEDNVDTILKTSTSIKKQTGIAINEKDIFKEIGKLSAATTVSLGMQPEQLAKAVATAKSLGFEMAQLEGIASNLLDFESSIESELEAELLTGKNLTLEKARQAALDNDMATLAKEIANNAGSAADFAKMNRIQQEAMAKAVGMSREDLAKTVFVQDQLKGLSEEDAKNRQKILDKRIAQVGLEQAMREEREDGIELLEQQAHNAERFGQMVEKIKDTFTAMADGPLGTVLSMIGKILQSSTAIYTITGLIAGIYGGKMIAGLAATTAKILLQVAANTGNAAAATAAAAAMSFGTVIPIILTGIGLVAGAIAAFTADDMLSPGQGTSGYGKRTLFGPEGAIQLNDKDTVIAGTNLFGNDVMSEPNKSTEMGEKGSLKISPTVDMSSTNSRLDAILAAIEKGSVIMFEGDKLGDTINLGARSI
jgi:hypothetical protein